MTPYSIGDITVLLEEVISIGTIHLSGSNYSHLDIYLRGGQKVVAEIRAIKEHEVGSTDMSSIGFVNRREKIIDLFIESWKLANSTNV